jgi:hypothetical protein
MYPSLTPSTTPLLSLEPILRCPSCGKSYHAGWLQQGITFPECQKCSMRWWAMLLARGLVLPQLSLAFEDEAIARDLVERYALPTELPERRFWQLALRPRDAFTHRETTPVVLFRAMLLLPKSAVIT